MSPSLPLPFFKDETAVKKMYGQDAAVRFFPPRVVSTNGFLAQHMDSTIRPLANHEFTAIGIGVIKTLKDVKVAGKMQTILIEKKFILIGSQTAFHLLGVCALTQADQEAVLLS